MIGSIEAADKILVAAIEATADAIDNGEVMPSEFEGVWSVLSAAVLTCGAGEGDDITDVTEWLIRGLNGSYGPDTMYLRFVAALGIERGSADWYEVVARYCCVRAAKLRAAAQGGEADV